MLADGERCEGVHVSILMHGREKAGKGVSMARKS